MNHKNYLMTGIAIFFVLLLGGAGVTYIFLTQQPAAATKSLAKVHPLRKSKQSQPKNAPNQVQTMASTKDSPLSSPRSAEKVGMESGASLVHASTTSVAPPTKPKAVSQALEVEKGKEEKLTLADLQFGSSQTGLKAKTKATLDTYAKRLRDLQWSVLIQGHTDETGSIPKNLHVGLRRANAVKQYLITKGISRDRLHAVSLGEYQPVCMDTTPACQLKNRRVSFSIARREGLKTQNADPVTQEKVALVEWRKGASSIELIKLPEMKDASSIELIKLPEMYVSTIDKQAKLSLIYPGPVHSTPPPSMPHGGEN